MAPSALLGEKRRNAGVKYYVKDDQIAGISNRIPKLVTEFASCPSPPSALHSTCSLCALQGPRGVHACHYLSLRRCVIVVDMAIWTQRFIRRTRGAPVVFLRA